jgi:TonB-linked SusC/RagA family outer membrane protein
MGQRQQSNSWGYAQTEVAYRGIPWDIPFDDQGRPIDVASIPVEELTWYSTQRQNPFHGNQWNYNRSGGTDMGADFVVNWQVLPWLTATNTTRLERNNDWSKAYYDGRDFSVVHTGPVLGSRIEESSSYPLGGYNNTTLLKASHRVNQHSISGMVGYEFEESPGIYRHGGEANGQPTGMDVISTGTAASMRTTGGFANPSAGWSGFGQATYSYADRYLLSASFRADASTKFAPNRRVGYFPSVSAGWILTNEEFMKGNSVLTYAKLRASYGVTGNSSISDFLYMNTYTLSGITYLGNPGAQPSRIANPDLGWETATMLSGGVDFSLFSWLEGSIDIYRNVNTDLLFSAPEPPSSGFYSSTRNIGSVSNRGVELQLSTVNFSRPNFSWTTSFNISFNKNRVESLPKNRAGQTTGDVIMVGAADAGGRQRLEEGRELYSWYMKKWMGVNPDDGAPLWWGATAWDADGNVTQEGLTSVWDDATPMWLGSATPKFSGGLVNNVAWKGFSLGVNLYFIYGNKIYVDNVAVQDDGMRMQYNQPAMPRGFGWTRWEKAGDVAEFPRLIYNNSTRSNYPSSRFLFDGSFLRVRNVNLGYTLPEKTVSRVGLKSIRVFFSGDNLFTISKVPVPDPETSLSSTGIESPAGEIGAAYPLNRTFSLGAEIKF